MNNTIYSFLITLIAGLTTLIGIIPCFIKEKYKDTIITSSLAFSSSIMITISILDLIPESIKLQNTYQLLFPSIITVLILIVLGIIFSNIINHHINSDNTLYKLGLLSIITIILHNIPEGIATYISSSQDQILGLKLGIAIALHNIPEGISIAIPIYYSTHNLKKTFLYTFISGLSEFLGALLTYLFLQNYISNQLLSITLAITSGIMINISLTELLPTSLTYKKNKVTIVSFVLAIIIMYLSEKLLLN